MPLAQPLEHIYKTHDEAEEAIQTFAWQEGYSTKKLRTKADKCRKLQWCGLLALMVVGTEARASATGLAPWFPEMLQDYRLPYGCVLQRPHLLSILTQLFDSVGAE